MVQLDLLGNPSRDRKVVCKVCGRPLKSPESIVKGIGPICEKKLKR